MTNKHDGGKGDAPRPIGIPAEQFEKNWDAIFKKQPEMEPIPFAGIVDTQEYITPED